MAPTTIDSNTTEDCNTDESSSHMMQSSIIKLSDESKGKILQPQWHCGPCIHTKPLKYSVGRKVVQKFVYNLFSTDQRRTSYTSSNFLIFIATGRESLGDSTHKVYNPGNSLHRKLLRHEVLIIKFWNLITCFHRQFTLQDSTNAGMWEAGQHLYYYQYKGISN